MDYSYNYSYLQQYMDSHRLAKKDLLEALGCKDYVSLNKWLDGKIPVHITALLRFCNYYNVPLANFFTDGDGMPCDFAPKMPDANAQLLPTDGYGIKEGVGRGIVETRVSEREITSPAQAKAVAEGLKRQAEQKNLRDTMLAETPHDHTTQEETPAITRPAANNETVETILRMQLEHTNQIRKLEQEQREKEDSIRQRYDDERDRMMAIIEQQSREIARLSTGNHVRAYNNIQGDNSIIGVAEK